MESRPCLARPAPARSLAAAPAPLRLPSLLALALALSLALVTTACFDPHQDRAEEVMAGDCAACHINEWATVEEPKHVGNFPEQCSDCHLVSAWNPSFFSHEITNDACYGCHRTDYEATELPSHLLARFPQTCEECHSTDAWDPALDN